MGSLDLVVRIPGGGDMEPCWECVWGLGGILGMEKVDIMGY